MTYTDYPQYIDPQVSEDDDDGTMPDSIGKFADAVIGHKIVSVEPGKRVKNGYWADRGTKLTLDNGDAVYMVEEGDCCAYTELEEVINHLPSIDHAITGVKTTEGYTRWHILADLGEVMEFKVGWSCGNPFYYGYGFSVLVNAEEAD